jgi:hypothetical protein
VSAVVEAYVSVMVPAELAIVCLTIGRLPFASRKVKGQLGGVARPLGSVTVATVPAVIVPVPVVTVIVPLKESQIAPVAHAAVPPLPI